MPDDDPNNLQQDVYRWEHEGGAPPASAQEEWTFDDLMWRMLAEPRDRKVEDQFMDIIGPLVWLAAPSVRGRDSMRGLQARYDSDDALQSAYLDCFAKARLIKFTKENWGLRQVVNYLRVVASRRVFYHMRKRAPRDRAERQVAIPGGPYAADPKQLSPDEQAAEREVLERLQKMCRDPKDWDKWVKPLLEGQGFRKVAKDAGYAVSTLRVRYQQLVRRLQKAYIKG